LDYRNAVATFGGYMPKLCPKNKLGYADCLNCSDKSGVYCTALCPPKTSRVELCDILSLEERICILEDKVNNTIGIEDFEIDNLADWQKTLSALESKIKHDLEEMKKLVTLFQGKFQYLNTLSKKIVTLEESSKSKGKGKYENYS
jgi:hypothetical protein